MRTEQCESRDIGTTAASSRADRDYSRWELATYECGYAKRCKPFDRLRDLWLVKLIYWCATPGTYH